MFIYLVERVGEIGYDEYDSFVCIAVDENTAQNMYPDGDDNHWGYYSWISKDDIAELTVTCIGTAHTDQQQAIILASFNAG